MLSVLELLPDGSSELASELSGVVDGLKDVHNELRELSRGIHPAIVSQGGLHPALRALARRSPIPVELDLPALDRLPEPIEVAAHYAVSEALTNAAKHSAASVVRVEVVSHNATLRLSIHDYGVGGADPARGSGILGLTDRVHALGGTIDLSGPVGLGTTIILELPIDAAVRPRDQPAAGVAG